MGRFELSMAEFLASGRLGPIRLGMPEHDVLSFLGEPTDTGGTSRKHPRPAIWLYGQNVEIVFDPEERAVSMILVNFWRDRELAGSAVRIASHGITAGMSREAFVDVLAALGLRYETKRAESDSAEIVVEDKVSAIFGTENAAQYRLLKLIAS